MVLDKLSSSLKATLSKIAKAMFVDEKLVNELVKEIQRALLSADVNVQQVFDLSETIKKRALEEKAPSGMTQKDHLINIVYEELVKFLGEEGYKIEITKGKKKPFKIMMIGLFGSGKTTTILKIAHFFQKRGYKVATLGLDVHRPAAPEQLEQLSKQINVPCYINKKEKNPLKIYNQFTNDLEKYDIIIIDTAGRDALSEPLIDEIRILNKNIISDENLLVISADIGQSAMSQSKTFHEACGITGIVVTKLDGTAKAGGALSACSASGAPIKFIGTGEKVDDLETFNPKGFVSRMLGMGDIEALLEKTKEAVTEEEAKDLGKRFLKGEFNFLDLYEQMQALQKMGPLSKITELIPGFGKLSIPKEMFDVQEEKLKKWKFILQSMTKEELENPDVITASRVERIAKGAGVKVTEVRELLKQYKQAKKMMKLMKGAGAMGKEQDVNKLMKQFKGKLPKGFAM